MSDDVDHYCKHMVGDDHKARRRCQNVATVGDYCGRHYRHPERELEKRSVSLHDFVESAMRALGDIVENGEKDADRVRAANSILDRTGHIPGQAITLHGASAEVDERLRNLLNDRTHDRTDNPDD